MYMKTLATLINRSVDACGFKVDVQFIEAEEGVIDKSTIHAYDGAFDTKFTIEASEWNGFKCIETWPAGVFSTEIRFAISDVVEWLLVRILKTRINTVFNQYYAEAMDEGQAF